MAFPAGLKVAIEWVSGTFTDVTLDVDTSVQISIHYGRTSPGDAPQVATLSLRLANPLGKYTPLRQVLADGVTAHPYYPNVQPRKRIQVSYTIGGTTYPRFTGYIKGFPPSLENGVRPYVDITASDITDQLSRIMFATTMLQEISQDNPTYLWPLTDAAGSTSAAEVSGNNPLSPLTLAPFAALPVFGGNGPGSGDGTGAAFATFESLTAAVSVTTSYTMECWVNFAAFPANAVNPMQSTGPSTGGGITVLPTGALVNPAGGTAALLSLNNWHNIALTSNGTNALLYLDGALVATATGFGVPLQTTMGVGDTSNGSISGLNMSMGYVAIYPAILSAARVAAHASAGFGYYGDTTGARIARVLGLCGFTSALWNLDAGIAIVGTYPEGGANALQYCQDMATTEGGGSVFYVTPDGNARFADRTFRRPGAPALTVDAQNDLSAASYSASFDESTLQNQCIVVRSSESGADSTQTATNDTSAALPSAGGYGLFSNGLTSYATTDLDALNNAEDVVARNAFPGFRFPQIGVNLLTAENALYVQVAAVQIGSRIRLTNIPAGVAPSTQADSLCEGWTETWGFDTYLWVADTSPADVPPHALWSDTVYGRWQALGQTLTAAITAAATSLSITTSGSNPTFTTSAGAYPMTIQIGQEVIKLNSAPGGSSSPQAFTGVTRAQNGTPAASQTIGSTVTLWPATTWAM